MDKTEVQKIIDAGGSVTDEYIRLLERWSQFHEDDTNVLDRLTDAIVGDGTAEEIANLRSLAIASAMATTVTTATVRNHVLSELDALLAREYAKTAAENYDVIRDQFNREAEAFMKAHQVVPATTDAATLVTAPEKTRKAWSEGQSRAAGLTGLVPLLVAAARLAGVPVFTPTSPIGLVAQVEGLHRRRVWEAWEQGWTAMLELGATIHAPRLDDFTNYREPKPIELRPQRSGIGWRQVEVDPEDDDYQPAEQPRFTSL